MKLYVLSQSEIKKKAITTSYLIEIFKDIEFVSKDKYEKENLKIEQPYNDGGKIICRNRINNFLEMNKINDCDWILSIENYIEFDNNYMHDIAICEFYHNKLYESNTSLKAVFPYLLYEYLLKETKEIYIDNKLVGYDNTIGKIFEKYVDNKDKNITHNNWISYYNNFDRITQIQSSLNKFILNNSNK